MKNLLRNLTLFVIACGLNSHFSEVQSMSIINWLFGNTETQEKVIKKSFKQLFIEACQTNDIALLYQDNLYYVMKERNDVFTELLLSFMDNSSELSVIKNAINLNYLQVINYIIEHFDEKYMGAFKKRLDSETFAKFDMWRCVFEKVENYRRNSNSKDYRNFNFICACIYNDSRIAISIADQLKNDKTFDVNTFTFDKQTLLHLATELNAPKIIQVLFELGHAFEPKNKYGLTPLQVAQKKNNAETVEALLTQKAYLRTKLDLAKRLEQHSENFHEPKIIYNIMGYINKTDIKPDKSKEK